MKWGMPHFQYKGMLCAMSAFKAHCAFSFWQGGILFPKSPRDAMGHFGRITSVDDLPAEEALIGFVRQAMQLNDDGLAAPVRTRPATPQCITPDYFTAALKANQAAQATFDTGSPSFKREYVYWVTGAKTETTRDKRMTQAIEWLAEGKPRNWKYAKC